MQNAKYEFMCMDKMIQYYKWLFEVKDEEEAKEKVSATTTKFLWETKNMWDSTFKIHGQATKILLFLKKIRSWRRQRRRYCERLSSRRW